MAVHFLDTSAVVKRYRVEVGTAMIDRLFDTPGELLAISRLGLIETVSAFAIKVRTGDILVADYQVAKHRFLNDVKSRRLIVIRLMSSHLREAERLISEHAVVHRLRTLDAVQLAVARNLGSGRRAEFFVTADAVLQNVAKLEGFPLVDLAAP